MSLEPSSSYRDQWLFRRKGDKIKLINQTITIPAFSATCGLPRGSMHVVNATSNPCPVTTNAGTPASTTARTWDFYYKHVGVANIGPLYATIYSCRAVTGGTGVIMSYTPGTGFLRIRFVTSGGQYDISLNASLSHDWTRYTIVFDGANNLGLFYINGILQGTVATTGTLASDQQKILFGEGLLGYNNGFFADIRLYNETFTILKIEQTYGHRNVDGIALDGNLVSYYKCNVADANGDVPDAKGVGTVIDVDAPSEVTEDELPPIGFGASFICYRITVSGLSESCSLRFPVIPPTDVNHCMCVLWQDTNGDWQRRKLYSAQDGSEDFQPVPADYNGEPLGTTFYLEIWNVDTYETADLAEDLVIELSLTTQPTLPNDQTPVSAATPGGTGSIFAALPWTFPVDFDEPLTFN